MKWFRRRNAPWEVVGCETIAPVLMFDSEVDSLDEEIEFVYAEGVDTCRRYIFDFTSHTPSGIHCASAVLFARQQLLQQVEKRGFNVLLQEGWTLTLLRQGRRHRIQVDYTGRPGCVSGKLPPLRPPPFMALLEGQHIFS
ncbi:hypothetical protein SCLCIDRAFT_21324 [Scleroderma citrinum Foug A]|uniref:Uncharacterized protein n=1 Tax=Scleroderma citrinum Foug A TaxID=1036808 RepID=A0A0C3E2A8_9AGAM|nr:hypothetical protein SCLCIDRAFT_21324 [Scleroderma citrinum Foug A]